MNNLIRSFREFKKTDNLLKYINQLQQIVIPKIDYDNRVNFIPNEYTRNVIYRNEIYEILLICWGTNSFADIHDHSSNGCIMKILDGSLMENKYNTDFQLIETKTLHADDISYIHNNLHYHSITNFNKPSVSLHIYSPPNYISNLKTNSPS